MADSKPKILFVAEEYSTNGAMMSLMALLNAIDADRYDVSLFMFKHNKELSDKLPGHIKLLPELLPYTVHRMPLRQALKRCLCRGRLDLAIYRLLVARNRWAVSDNFRLWRFLPTVKGVFDIVCCYADGFVAPMIMRKVNATKKVCWIHFTYSDWPQPQYVYRALKQADMCVPVSAFAGQDLNKTLNTSLPQTVIHNITDADICIRRSNESCETPVTPGIQRIVSVGRVSTPKNFTLIPATARILRDNGLQFEWYVIGEGSHRQQLIRQIDEMGLADCVHFIGARANPMPWIRSADVFVNPSAYESWGMTVSEALCLGKAVITSDIPVFAEQIVNGVNGIMVKPTPENISNAITNILSDNTLRSKLESNAVQYPYTKTSIVKEFDSMIDSIMSK